VRIFVHCADPREEADLDSKISKWFVTPGERVVKLSLFGGPICLVFDQFQGKAQELIKDICFAIDNRQKFGAAPDEEVEVVLVGHTCQFYSQIGTHPSRRDQELHLADAIGQLQQKLDFRYDFPVIVSGHFDITVGENIAFEEVVPLVNA